MNEKMKGGCACGTVQYEIEGKAKLIVNCHCQGCRTRNGAPFSTYCTVSKESFVIVRGEEKLGIYGMEEVGKKHFCRQCGTPLYNFNQRYPEMYMVYYGTVSGHAELAPRFNIYCESKLPWVDGISRLRSFEQAFSARGTGAGRHRVRE